MGKTFTKSLFLFLFSLLVITAAHAQTITVGAIDPGPYGQGSTVGVPVHIDNTSGCIATSNTYRLYLSDASGSFASQVQIGTYAGFYATFVNGIIPATTPAGTGYRVRVVSTNPSVTSNASISFAINAVTGVVASVSSQTLNASYPEVFGACIGTNNASYPFINNSTAGATVTATFFNEITQSTEGTPKPIPGTFNAALANYTVTVKAVRGGVVGTKSYTLINNDLYRTVGNSGSNTACTDGSPLSFPIPIDDNGVGLKYNYPGLLYKVTWGDGTNTTYRYCDIVSQGSTISHVFTKSSCGNNVGAQKNVFRVELTPTNLPYCTSTVIPGVAYARIVTPPKNDFLHPVAACLNNQVTFTNISDPGQDPGNTTTDCKNLDAKYTWYVDDNPEKIDFTVTQSFKYTFTTAGMHKVRLHLQNPNALCDVVDREYLICIQEPPRPVFTVPVNSGCLPLAITPNNTSFIDDNCDAGNSYIWKVTGPAPVKYQGGTSATSKTPQFLFDVAGVYTIKLSIKTVSCGTIDAPNTETIVVDGPPIAILSPDKDICGINQTFTFDGTAGPTQSTISGSAQPGPGNYVWTVTGGAFEFTGGTTASSRYPQILFKDAAAYTVSVTASSACGIPKSDSQVLTFQSAPVVDAGTSAPVCNGNAVPLQGTVTNGAVTSVLWTGGAGTFSNANNLTTTYTPTVAEYAAGSVTLTLTGFTSLGAPCNQIPDNITINFQPVNAVNSINTYFTCPGVALGYNITALQPGSVFNWTVDAANTSATITGFNATGSGNVINDVLQNSDINNSSTITYNITATNGTCTSDVFVLTVTVGPKSPVANFTHNLPGGAACGNTVVLFTNTSAPMNGSTFEWDFGDESTSTDVNPSHQFLPKADGSDAVYNVTLTTTSPCGIATSVVQTITVRPLVPVVRIVPPFVAACLPVTLNVKNESPGTNIDYTYFLYKYNDTKTDSTLIASPTVITKDPVDIGPVTAPGNYTLFMRARGYCGTTGETVHIPITIDARSFDSQIFPTGLTEGCDGEFTAQIFNNSTPGNSYTYFISNSDGTFNDSKPAVLGAFSYIFPSPGIYYITLTTQNSCDIKTSSALKFTVYNKPRPDFSADLITACRELTVTFTNNTLPDPTTQASAMSYEWDFGDGTTSALYNPPPHKYVARNTPYTVTLTATIPLTGCTNTITKSDYIIITQPPGTNFDVKPGLVANLPNYRFEFIDRTTGHPTNWLWDFGDNTTASTQNTNHTYADTGKYTVTLKVIDDKGCDSTFKQEVRITGIPGQLYLPNAFQPQGSSTVLQKFMAKGSGIAKWNLQIFNNWGQLLWQTSALSSTGEPVEGWDGTFKGAPVQQGTYIWQASAVFINGTEWKGMSYNGSLPKRSGYIHLIK